MTDLLNSIEKYLKDLSQASSNLIFIDPITNLEEPKIKQQINSIEKISQTTKINSSFNMTTDFLDSEKDLFTEKSEWMLTNSLDELYSKIHSCQNCPLGATRLNFVFGSGNPNAEIMFIGEAPGADEDEQGLPFVGRAGQLLTKIIESINFKRSEVYIANILKCRPPGNRQPTPGETNECQPYLLKQIELIKPAFIVLLGLTAADTFFRTKHKMAESRGKITDFQGIKVLITYHPAALLRNPDLKRPVWEDVKLLRRLYDEYKKEL